MKAVRIFLFIALSSFLVTNPGCKTVERALYNSIRANVNSILFSTQIIQGTVVAGQISIVGSTSTGSQAMTIIVPATIQPGTYKLTSMGSYLIEYKASNHDVYAASSGELIITNHDIIHKKIKGTFNFKGLNLKSASVDVTNGSFTVSYY